MYRNATHTALQPSLDTLQRRSELGKSILLPWEGALAFPQQAF